eukprot:TRINITY_DN4765_c0_g1_i1.p1 TRINITY_DN4765_c0_g1~~TRINITY_DN4765_c0_g1_i1.p1  ORF type:complete len:924 (-),score=222.32 TRINITY_DN4765_c0_g1_i1:154-2925(-)
MGVQTLLAQEASDVKNVKQCAQIIGKLLVDRWNWSNTLQQQHDLMKNYEIGSLTCKTRPRALKLLRIQALHASFLKETCWKQHESSPWQAMLADDLLNVALCGYAQARATAQSLLHSNYNRRTQCLKRHIPMLLSKLDHTTEQSAATGAIFTLNNTRVLRKLAQRWDTLSSFVLATSSFENPASAASNEEYKMHQRVAALVENFHSVASRPRMLVAAVDPASLPIVQVPEHLRITDQQLEGAKRTFCEWREGNQATCIDTIDQLVDGFEKQPHWRYMIMRAAFLLFLLRGDVPTPQLLRVCKVLLDSSHSDSLPLREFSTQAMSFVLASVLRAHKGTVSKPKDGSKTFAEMDHAELEAVCGGDRPFQDRPFVTDPRPRKELCSEHQSVRELVAEAVAGDWLSLFLDKVVLDHSEVAGATEQAECPFSRCVVMRCDAQSRSNALEDGFSNDINSVTAQFVKRVACLLGEESLSALQPSIEKFVDSSATRQQQCTAAELIAGLLRGSRQWEHSERSQELLPLIRKGLVAAPTIDTMSEWLTVFAYVSYDTDPRRLGWVVDELVDQLQATDEPTRVQTKSYRLLLPLIENLGGRGIALCKAVLEAVSHESVIAHPYKQMREAAAKLLLLVSEMCFWSGRLKSERAACIETISRVIQRGDLTQDSPEAKESGSAAETLLLLILHGVSSPTSLLPTMALAVEVLPLVLGMAAAFDKDLLAEAQMAIKSISWIPQGNQAVLGPMLAAMEGAISSKSWKIRDAALSVVQGVSFCNPFLLGDTQKAQLVLMTATALRDKTLENCRKASKTLSGLMRCLIHDEAQLQEMQKKFEKESSKSVEKAATTKHAGVLGLIAMLQLHPYRLAEWGPRVLTIISTHVSAPMPISGSVRDAFNEFWRTQKDNWAATKELFDAGELDCVQDLLVSPHYFA